MGPNDTPDLSGLRYGKVCILSDADVDGSHIQVLLLTLFFRHFPKLIETGHVFVARPPLFRVDAPARGKKPASKAYALDEGELTAILDKLRKEGVREGAWSISRFKGLGEMNAEQLWDTTLNPDTRRLLPVQLGTMDFMQTESLITKLMGKGEAAARRELMELHGDSGGDRCLSTAACRISPVLPDFMRCFGTRPSVDGSFVAIKFESLRRAPTSGATSTKRACRTLPPSRSMPATSCFSAATTTLQIRDGALAAAVPARVTARPVSVPTDQPRLVAYFEVAPGFRTVKHCLREASVTHDIDYELLKALIATESGFDASAVSPKGAVGLMQVMPATAGRYGVVADKQGHGRAEAGRSRAPTSAPARAT